MKQKTVAIASSIRDARSPKAAGTAGLVDHELTNGKQIPGSRLPCACAPTRCLDRCFHQGNEQAQNTSKA